MEKPEDGHGAGPDGFRGSDYSGGDVPYRVVDSPAPTEAEERAGVELGAKLLAAAGDDGAAAAARAGIEERRAKLSADVAAAAAEVVSGRRVILLERGETLAARHMNDKHSAMSQGAAELRAKAREVEEAIERDRRELVESIAERAGEELPPGAQYGIQPQEDAGGALALVIQVGGGR